MLPVLLHDQLQCRLVLFQRNLQLILLLLEISDLPTLLDDVHDERRAWLVLGDVVQHADVILILQQKVVHKNGMLQRRMEIV